MPQFVTAALSFLLVLILIKKRVDLGFALVLAALFLGIASSLPPPKIARTFVSAVISTETLNLALVLVLILLLENVMDRLGLLEKMVSSLKSLLKDERVAMASLPALIGFLPSAGGALFSAPMVDSVAGGHAQDIVPEKKAFINYWYRHVWEYTLPMYPAVVLSSRIVGLPLGQIMRIHSLLTVTAILAGIPFAFTGLYRTASAKPLENDCSLAPPTASHADRCENKAGSPMTSEPRDSGLGCTFTDYSFDTAPRQLPRYLVWRDFLIGILPILTVIALVLIANIEIVPAAALVLGGLLVVNAVSWDKIKGFHRKAWAPRLMTLVIGLVLFKGMLETAGTAKALPEFFSSFGIPPWVLTFLIPFSVGLLTGYNPAVVAISFPLIVPFFPPGHGTLGAEVLAYAAGFSGVLLSPTHLCLLLTAEFFDADLSRVYRLLLVPVGAIVAVSLLLNFFL